MSNSHAQIDSLIQENLIGNLFKTIQYSEMDVYEDVRSPYYNANAPYMRTDAIGTGSSAVGPLGLTGGSGSMMRRVGRGIVDVGATQEEIDWINNVFLPMADKFLDNVDETKRRYTPFGYGGRGIFDKSDPVKYAEDTTMYDNIGKKLIENQYNLASKYSGDQLENFFNLWSQGTDTSKWNSPLAKDYRDKSKGKYEDIINKYNIFVSPNTPSASQTLQ